MDRDEVARRGWTAHQTMLEVATQAMNEATLSGGDVSSTLYIGLSAVAGALAPVAALMGFTPSKDNKQPSQEDAKKAMNNTAFLVAALLTAKVNNFKPNGDTAMDYGPNQIFKAIDAAQKVLGSDPRPHLSKPMVKAADMYRPDERLGNSWSVENSPTLIDDERPRYLN